MTARGGLAFLLLLAAAAPAAAQVQPQPGPGDPRLQTIQYSPDQVVALRAALGYQLTVEFAPDEQVESVAVGDSAAWQVTANHRGDHLFIKPLQAGAPTNMTVITNVRTYAFELRPSEGGGADTPYTVHFLYPQASAESHVAAIPDAVGRYHLSGERSLLPSRISDDGVHTYIQWPAERSLPAVYALDARGSEALVNGMMRDDIFVIDSVQPQLVFRVDNHIARAVRVAAAETGRRTH